MDIKLYVLVNSQETQNSMQTAYFKPVSEKESHQISLLAFQKMAIFSSLVDPHHYIMSTQMSNTSFLKMKRVLSKKLTSMTNPGN